MKTILTRYFVDCFVLFNQAFCLLLISGPYTNFGISGHEVLFKKGHNEAFATIVVVSFSFGFLLGRSPTQQVSFSPLFFKARSIGVIGYV